MNHHQSSNYLVTGMERLSPYLAAFHYVRDEEMSRMHQLIYGLCNG